MTRGGFVVVAAAVVIDGACLSSQVTRIGPVRAMRPANCPVYLYPTTRPPYPLVELASIRAECSLGRHRCVDEILRQTCAVGGDTAFGFSEGVTPRDNVFITATAAVKTVRESDKAEKCEPICSPGFACDAGNCIPQCNPACDAGEVCNRKRVCEPAADGAGPTGASQSP